MANEEFIPEEDPSGIIDPSLSNEQIIEEINADNEKDYLKQLKKKNKGFLIENLSKEERKRIAKWICDRYKEALPSHNLKCDRLDKYDSTYRMERKSLPGDDGSMPNYVTPLSTVTVEVLHSTIMNVIFSPKDVMRVLPTEANDIPKVNKITTFGNWSMNNEMDLYTNADRIFHYSTKVGESPYLTYWHKKYGVEIKREIVKNPANPEEPLFDPDTQDPIYQEVEETKLLYNGPKLEPFSAKDYIYPENSTMDDIPEWEGRIVRKSYDTYLREELQGKMYAESIDDIQGWGSGTEDTNKDLDFDGGTVPMGEWEQDFLEFYGRLRINLIKDDKSNQVDEEEELEDEFISLVHIPTETLCQLRKNKFPLKMRPIGVDYLIPDDEGRRRSIGAVEFLESIQTAYDAFYNQYIFGVMQSNNPFGFFNPVGNQRDEAIKIKNGYLYPSSDPNGVNIIKIPPPDGSIANILDRINQWAQLLFGISDYTAGMESSIDPSAPAKKAEIVVQQGNVRMNNIIKRKNKTLRDIFLRWFLLYKANMPSNKFMRIAGTSQDNPWEFQAVTLSDFALQSLPDFELTGNILNSNKTLEASKALATYNILLANPFFSPQTAQGLQSLHSLTKWLLDKIDDGTGVSRFLPPMPTQMIHTPEEENALFLQGDNGEAAPQEDHIKHIKVHNDFLLDPTVQDEIKQIVVEHIKQHIKLLREQITQQIVLSQTGMPPGGQGGMNVGGNGNVGGTPQAFSGMVPNQPANMG